MNLKDEIQTFVKRLEDIKNLQVPDIDSIREKIDGIEYNFCHNWIRSMTMNPLW